MGDGNDFEPDTADRRGSLSIPPIEKALPVIFYGAAAIWVAVVAINVWIAWSTNSASLQQAPASIRWQFIVSAVSSAWGYFFIAVVALIAKAALRDRH